MHLLMNLCWDRLLGTRQHNKSGELWSRYIRQPHFLACQRFVISCRTLKKMGSAFAYIQHFRSLCNNMASAGSPVSYSDQLLYFLNGLGREYNPYVSAINTRFDQPQIEDIYNLLLQYDARLSRQDVVETLAPL